MMGRREALAALLLLATPAPTLAARRLPPCDLVPIVDRRVAAMIAERSIPGGYVIGLLVHRRLVLNKAYGHADAERGTALASNALFPIASLTKTFTAALAVRLAADGIVDLDCPVDRYLPMQARFHPSVGPRVPTLRALLTHTSGLPRDHPTRRNLKLDLAGGFDPGIADPASYSRAAFYKGLAQAPLHAPGTHLYSNMGMHLAGHVLECATGRRYEDLIGEAILRPLGMRDTAIGPSPEASARVPRGYAFDAVRNRHVAVPAWQAGEIVGGAGLVSTVADLGAYVAALLDPSRAARVLGGPRWGAELLRPEVSFLRGEETLYDQALGWRMSRFGRYGIVHRHNGNADGHNGFIAFSRPHRLGVIVLTNSSLLAMERLGNEVLLDLLTACRS